MTGIKRWLAAILAGMLLFSCAAASAEENGRDTVDIQESLVTREYTDATLEDHFLQLAQLVQKDEVRNLLKIEDAAFEKCASLQSAVFPNGLQTIGGDAFKGCLQLKEVELPVTIKELGGSAFQECKTLAKVNILNPAPPKVSGDTFKGSNPIILVPNGAMQVYAIDKKWGKQKGVQENK